MEILKKTVIAGKIKDVLNQQDRCLKNRGQWHRPTDRGEHISSAGSKLYQP